MEQINTADVDDKDVLEGLFKENKEILDFLSSGLANNGKNQTPTRSQEKLGGISEEKDTNDDVTGKFRMNRKTSQEFKKCNKNQSSGVSVDNSFDLIQILDFPSSSFSNFVCMGKTLLICSYI